MGNRKEWSVTHKLVVRRQHEFVLHLTLASIFLKAASVAHAAYQRGQLRNEVAHSVLFSARKIR